MLPNQLDIYKASAGSGKTFLLTSQYLKLLFQWPHHHRHILAVTFTNKATSEMKGRILEVLREMAEGKQASPYVDLLLQHLPGISFDSLQKQASAIYSAILHDYSRFSVSTIDSFVQRIIRSFAFEMGMDASFRLQLNTDLVKEALADKLFQLLDTDKELQHWVGNVALQRLDDGKSWNFREEMINLAGQIFREEFQAFEQALNTLADAPTAFKSLQQKLYTSIRSFEKDWQETGEEAIRLIQNQDLTLDDFSYKSAGFAHYYYKAAAGKISEPGSRVLAILEDPSKMEGKTTNPAVEHIRTSLHRLLQQLVDMYTDRITEYNTARAIARNIGFLRLMKVFSEQLSLYRSENNMLLISDTHLLLRELTRETDASFIYEKTGNQFQHYLMDEFQDTSGFQWDNFRPLVDNTLAEGKYNLIVGDIKQAIYRWRSGDWKLLHRTVSEQLKAHAIKLDSLQDNHRSAKAIIAFNNYLYKTAPYILQETFNELTNKASANIRTALENAGYNNIITDAYKESHQLLPATTTLEGSVHIRFVATEKDDQGDAIKFKEQVLPDVHQAIIDLLAEGFQPKDIAILTRENKEATMLVNYLMEAMQQPGATSYALLSAEALLIKNNPAIHVMIAALEYLLEKNGKLSLIAMRQAYASYTGVSERHYEIFLQPATEEKILPEDFTSAIPALKQMSLPDLVNNLIALFDLNAADENTAYLLAFQDLIQNWTRYGNDGLLAFIEYWQEEGQQTSLPANTTANAVNVLTIHKSKGLAFTVLLLPFLSWNFKSRNTQLWVHTDHTPFSDIDVVAIPYHNDLANSFFAFHRILDPLTHDYKDEGYFPELLMTMMDNLNLLYVATTRARRRIIGWAPGCKAEDKISGIDKLLYAAATRSLPEFIFSDVEAADREKLLTVQGAYDKEEAAWIYGNDAAVKKQEAIDDTIPFPQLVQANWRNNLEMRYKPLQSEEEAADELPRATGTLMHEALASLLQPSMIRQTVQQLAQNGWMTLSQQQLVEQTLERIMQAPVMQLWAQNSMFTLQEKDIITPEKNLRRPDLILYNDEQTIVIDFKFTSASEAHIALYKHQLQEYITLLGKMNFKNVTGQLMFVTEDNITSIEAK